MNWIDRSTKTADSAETRQAVIVEAAALASRTAPTISEQGLEQGLTLPLAPEELLPFARAALDMLEAEWREKRQNAIDSEVAHGALGNFRELTDRLTFLARLSDRDELAMTIAQRVLHDRRQRAGF